MIIRCEWDSKNEHVIITQVVALHLVDCVWIIDHIYDDLGFTTQIIAILQYDYK